MADFENPGDVDPGNLGHLPALGKVYYFEPWGREDRRPVVAISAPSAARKLLNSQDWVDKPGELAIEAVKLQLETYHENAAKAVQEPITTLFDATAKKIGELIEEDPENNMDAVTSLFNPALARAAWKWPTLPYNLVCTLQSQYDGTEPEPKRTHRDGHRENNDVDTWILQNEDYLRQRLFKPNSNWTFGLVSLKNCDDVFSMSTLTEKSRQISRGPLDGFKCLDAKRAPIIHIQPNSQQYKKKFDELTNGQLEGLDWSNIFVAGGMALGALLCADDPENTQSTEQWLSSDIDIYIYGLNPLQANKKIDSLWTVFKKNLPPDAPTLVVRNSKTVSFLSNYPFRRFQIILKIVKSPAEVLLNFDLDICAMGFDGTELYMLPRAARALETGYNVFTMDMVQGHYLGTRRASQEQRVFKYANRGYGIKILQTYVDAIKNMDLTSLLPEAGSQSPWHQPRVPTPPPAPLDMETQVERARDYFDRLFKTYMSWSNGGTRLRRHYVQACRWHGSSLLPTTDKPIFTHALLDTLNQKTSEPLRRSCLTGFELFYRHVALWEAEQAGNLHIQNDVWASTTYEDIIMRTSYEELPKYAWDPTFSTEDFHRRITLFNTGQSRDAASTFEVMGKTHTDLPRQSFEELYKVQRIVSGSTLEEVQEADITIPIWMPHDFVEFAQGMIREVAQDHKELTIGRILETVWTPSTSQGTVPLVLVVFKLSPTTVYQQFDRRLDEIYEAVWSFMYSNSIMEGSDFERARLLRRQLSRRALRRKPEDEFKDFACWVRRDPGSIAGTNYGAMGQGFWDEFDGDEEDEDEDEE